MSRCFFGECLQISAVWLGLSAFYSEGLRPRAFLAKFYSEGLRPRAFLANVIVVSGSYVFE